MHPSFIFRPLLILCLLVLVPKANDSKPQAHESKPEPHESKPEAHESNSKTHGDKVTPAPKRVDTTFASALDWDDGQAEILSYAVNHPVPGGEIKMQGQIATEKLWMNKEGRVGHKSSGKLDFEILNAAIVLSWKEDSVPRAVETVVQIRRRGHYQLLRQEQSLQSWPSVTHRSLDCRTIPPRLRTVSSGGEADIELKLKQWPIYTEEMLFLYLRTLPLREGYREEIWLFEGGQEGRLVTQAQYSVINIRSKATGIRDMETWYVTIDRENGRRSEFWLSTTGLHPVVMAILKDRSVWTLNGISRRNYKTW